MVGLKLLGASALVFTMGVTPLWAQELVRKGDITVNAPEVQFELERLDETTRKSQYSKPEVVKLHASNMLVRRALAAEAVENKLDQDPEVAFTLRQARERILSDAMLSRIDEKNKADDAAAEAYARSIYAANIKRFEVPEQVRVRHILIRGNVPDAEAKIEEILTKLKQGASFEDLARESSNDPGSASRGGDLGWFTRGRMVKAFEDAAFSLATTGQLSDVVKTQFGFHVLQLVEKKPQTVRPFEEVKATVLKEAQAAFINEGRIKLQDRIWADAQYNDKSIEDLAKWASQR